MYVIVGKQNCIQCDEFKNLLDEQGIQYNYLHITEMPNKTMKCLRMYCNSFPIGLCIINSFSNFEEALTHFEQIQIPASQVDFFFILNSRFLSKSLSLSYLNSLNRPKIDLNLPSSIK